MSPHPTRAGALRPIGRRASTVIYGLVSLAAIAAMTYTLSAPAPPVLHLAHSAATGYLNPASPYEVGETYGGTNPIDTCTGCDFWGHQEVGTAVPPTTQPSQLVNPLTGDIAENYTLFSQPDPGFNFAFNLTYDSLWGQLFTYYEGLIGNTGNEFYGYGWRSNLSTDVVGSGGSGGPQNYTSFAVSPPGGAIEYFYPTSACQGGMSSKTEPGSSANFCTPDRVDAEFSTYNSYGNYQLYEHGGLQVLTYNYFGEVVNEGTIENPDAQTVLWNQVPHQSGCPANIGSQGVSQCTVDFDQQGRTYDVAWSGSNNVYMAIGVQDPTGAQWPFAYDANSNLAGVIDPNGHSWLFGYDSGAGAPDEHDLTGIKDPNNNQTSISYTPAGTNGGYVASVVDAQGNQTTYSGYNTYDEDNGYTYLVTQDNPNGQAIDYQATQNMLQLETTIGTSGDSHYSATTEHVYNGTDTGPQEIVTDPMGNSTTYDTDEVGNVLQETNSYGTTTTTYNGYDQPCWSAPPGISYPTPANCVDWPTIGTGATEYDADEYGNMREVIDPSGVATETQFDGNANPCWTSAPGVLENNWPACSSPPSDSTRYSYSTGGLLQSESTPDGSGSSYTYDTTSYIYNGYGEITSETNPLNATASYVYDAAGRLYQTTAPLNRTTTATLDAAGNVTSVTDPMGQVTSAAYDSDERLCWKFQGSASPSCGSSPQTATRYTYNANTSDPSSVTDPNGETTTYVYGNPDVPDQPTLVTDPLGNITSNIYDLDGNLCVSGTGSTSLYASGDPSCGWISGYTYDTFDMLGNVRSSEDPNGNTTTYARGNDAYPSDVTIVTPQSGTNMGPTNYTYNMDGRAIQEQEGTGAYVSIAYDSAGNKCWQAPVSNTSASCATAVPVGGSSWSYNHSELPNTMSDVVSTTQTNSTTWSYDAAGELTGQTNSAGTVGYGYDAAGDNTCVAYPVVSGSSCANGPSSTNSVVDYGYDSDGRITSTTDWIGGSFSFGYDNRSNLTSITFPSSTTWTEAFGPYDAANNVKTVAFTSPTYGTSSTSYPVNNDEELSGGPNGATYGYNAQDRISTTGAESFTYYPNGELKSDTASGVTVTGNYNSDDEESSLAAYGSVFEAFAYDANGNRCGTIAATTTPSCTAPTSGTTIAGFNAYNQLCFDGATTVQNATCSTQFTSAVTTYSYDGNGLRVADNAGPGGAQQKFVYDTQTRAGQPLIIEDGTNAYVYGPANFGSGTAPIEQISLSSKTPSFISSAPAGVAAQVSSTGAVQGDEVYTAYGQPTKAGSISTPFGFQGSYTDPNGLQYLFNRYYDPTTGQFLNVDPMASSTGQPYEAFGDNPLNSKDPTGMYFSCGGGCAGQAWPNPIAGGPPTCSAGCGNGYVPPPAPSTAQIGQAVQASESQQWIAEVNEAAAAFKTAELQQQELLNAESWARTEINAGAQCFGTTFASTQPYYEGPMNCSPAQIAQAGGFYGCSPGANACSGNAWVPTGSRAVGFNSMTGSSFGPWGEGILSFLDGCWEGGGIGTGVGSVEPGGGNIAGFIGGCISGGVGEVGATAGVKHLAGGG